MQVAGCKVFRPQLLQLPRRTTFGRKPQTEAARSTVKPVIGDHQLLAIEIIMKHQPLAVHHDLATSLVVRWVMAQSSRAKLHGA